MDSGRSWHPVDVGIPRRPRDRHGRDRLWRRQQADTPGKLHILGKARNHRSSLYDAEMPFTLRLTNDGVSIHASSVRWGAATHGCIGVPLPFAERLFNAAKLGDDVVVVGSPPGRRKRSLNHVP